MAEILVVDDEPHICEALRLFLSRFGHQVSIASNAQDALHCLATIHPALVLMDIRMPGTDGLEVLERMRAIEPQLCVVMMTGYGTSQTSIEAMRLGAFDYLTKPLDLDTIKAVVERALEVQALSREASTTLLQEWEHYTLVNLVGQSAPMQEVYKRIGILTTNDLPVLILGEPGVGKLTVAKTIHFNSHRKTQPFVTVDCQALPDSLLERELFGQEGADGGQGRTAVTRGKVEAAQGGTLFLAHLGAMSLPLQARLHRLLVEQGFERLPGSGSLRADIRVMAAHATDGRPAVQRGQFHAALWDALGVLPLTLPPLHQRREDIPTLVAHFVQRCNETLRKSVRGVDTRVLQRLTDYAWPANVRELQQVITRACLLARGDVITSAEIDLSTPASGSSEPCARSSGLETSVRQELQRRLEAPPMQPGSALFHAIVAAVEAVLIREALEMTAGNQVKAAELLGLNRTTLRQKIRLYGVG